jgi:hypothetical protein
MRLTDGPGLPIGMRGDEAGHGRSLTRLARSRLGVGH